MFIRNLNECKEIIAIDGTILRELINPLYEDTELHLGYSIAHTKVPPRKASFLHRLTKASEVHYFLKRTGVMYVDDESYKVSTGSLVYVPPKTIQYLENTGEQDVVFLCIVDPYWRPEEEELMEYYHY
ncbi:MAG: cupin domain-containing protein [Promethearchaeota archaeon]